MLFLPPGSAKSTYGSILFPPWYLAGASHKSIIAASHTAELAERWGRKVRNIVEEDAAVLGYGLAGENRAAGRWETSAGGEYFAAGVGGSITGRRADLAIIDDPVRSREDADSETIRDKQWDWYNFDLVTRLKPDAAVILIMTRWHEDDLAGRILQAEEARWRVVRLPNDPRLLSQLSTRQYVCNRSDGKLKVESKDDYLKREPMGEETSSPDRADATVMAFFRGSTAGAKM